VVPLRVVLQHLVHLLELEILHPILHNASSPKMLDPSCVAKYI
jgi:hypothetical protein